MFSPMFPPRLIPETTRSGFSFRMALKARITASAGVPSMEYSLARKLVHVDRLAQRERLRGGAAFARRRDDGERGVVFQRVHQRAQAGSVDAVVVGDQNMRHEKSMRMSDAFRKIHSD